MKEVLQSWLVHQCQILSGSTRAVLLTGPPGEGPHDQALFGRTKVVITPYCCTMPRRHCAISRHSLYTGLH
ncbi:MAG: hypothetical protein GY850_23660 [bacterium]|nr:hypothetical protein [bacterium]